MATLLITRHDPEDSFAIFGIINLPARKSLPVCSSIAALLAAKKKLLGAGNEAGAGWLTNLLFRWSKWRRRKNSVSFVLKAIFELLAVIHHLWIGFWCSVWSNCHPIYSDRIVHPKYFHLVYCEMIGNPIPLICSTPPWFLQYGKWKRLETCSSILWKTVYLE